MGRFALAALAFAASSPVSASVTSSSETGFVIRLVTEVTASPDETWNTLISPADWWNGQHSYSGDAANLTIDPRASGCFCETLPLADEAPEGRRAGSIEHMRIIYAEPGRVLRMAGGLGPLQSEAVHGTMTITLKAQETGSRILWEYVVGGYMRYKVAQIAPAVDQVLAEQLGRLAERLGPVVKHVDPGANATPAEDETTVAGESVLPQQKGDREVTEEGR